VSNEGTAVPAVRRWLITQLLALQGAGEPLEGVKVQYSPLTNFDQALSANDGRIEAIYWTEWAPRLELRAFKGSANIKYREDGSTSDLIIVVAARDADDTLELVDQRAAELLGAVVLACQAAQPTSPGAHLQGITARVGDVEADPGVVGSAGTPVHAVGLRVSVVIQAQVEL
jgi:hypothetical protein